MHFLLFGASGRTGQHIVSELLSQNHRAVALIRNSSSLSPRPGLTIVTGTPLPKSDIHRALTAVPTLAPCAAIVTLNTIRQSDSPFAVQVSPPRFLADSCANICAVLEQAGAHRIVVMSMAGAGESWRNLPWLSKAFMSRTNIKYALEDHNLLDKEIRKTSMDWTLVRAVRLDFGKQQIKKEVEVLDETGFGMSVFDNIDIASVASFLVRVAVGSLYSRSAVVVRS